EPAAIRRLGPWTGGVEGDINRLRLAYRVPLGEQGFVVFDERASKLQLETVVGMHPANTDCPTCQGKGRVPMHGGPPRQGPAVAVGSGHEESPACLQVSRNCRGPECGLCGATFPSTQHAIGLVT